MVAEPGSSSETVIMKPTELKAMNIYIHSADIRQGCYCYEQYKFSMETKRRRQPTRSHDRRAASAAPNGGIELTKCIFHLLLIDLLIPNNIHVLPIYLPLPPRRSSGCPLATSISPSVTPSKQNESVYCGGGPPLTPLHSR